MAEKGEGAKFDIAFEQIEKWKTTTATSGTDSPAEHMNFFIGISSPPPAAGLVLDLSHHVAAPQVHGT